MASIDPKAEQDLRSLVTFLNSLSEHERYNKMLYFKPIATQKKFFDLGKTKRERCFFAGNRLGKSESGAFEAACHMTGDYPEWWEGRRFNRPTKGWVAGTTGKDVRNVAQSKLCGQYGVTSAFGTGFIPRDRFADKPTLARGVTDAYDTIQVVHKTKGVADGVSVASFKTYEQGRAQFQGDALDWGWADEEAPMTEDNDVYTEFLARLPKGMLFTTFTPLDGETRLTNRFLKQMSDDRGYVLLDLMSDEVWWYTADEKRQMMEGYPEWQRKARVNGLPLLGSGAVFPYDENLIKEPALAFIPPQWVALWALDFGIGHKFGAVLLLWDRDNDVIHVRHVIRMPDGNAPVHASAMKSVAAMVPVAWPHDGHQREKGSGAPLAVIYGREGLKMLPEHATFEGGGYSFEGGIQEMSSYIQKGHFKVAAECHEWFEEFRSYHRKNGQVVKENDDLMSATRIGVMARRFARAVPLGPANRLKQPQGVQLCDGVNPKEWEWLEGDGSPQPSWY